MGRPIRGRDGENRGSGQARRNCRELHSADPRARRAAEVVTLIAGNVNPRFNHTSNSRIATPARPAAIRRREGGRLTT